MRRGCGRDEESLRIDQVETVRGRCNGEHGRSGQVSDGVESVLASVRVADSLRMHESLSHCPAHVRGFD
jgi:hypothetical protein